MNKINTHKLGMVVGAFLGIWHVVWSVLVAVGLAQPLINFFLRIHFIDLPHVIAEFSFGSAVLLIIIASVGGYILGRIIGLIWNRLYRD